MVKMNKFITRKPMCASNTEKCYQKKMLHERKKESAHTDWNQNTCTVQCLVTLAGVKMIAIRKKLK